MGKLADLQRFKILLRDLSDRPCLLVPLFDRGLSIEESKVELVAMQGKVRMFKDGSVARRKIGRRITLDGAQKLLQTFIRDEISRLLARRLTEEAKAWLVEVQRR